MNLMFLPLTLPEAPRPSPNNLIKLTKSLGNSSSSFTNLEKLKGFPIMRSRKIDLILVDIQHGRANEINRLELVYCIQNKAQWDKQHPEQSKATSEAIWQFATQDLWLSRLLLWRLALYYSGQSQEVIAPKLAECFGSIISTMKRSQPLPVKIVEALTRAQPGNEVCAIAFEQLLTPKELLNSANLPPGISVVEQALNSVAYHFSKIKSPNEQQVEWLLICLNEMSVQQQVNAVNELLTQVPIKVGGSFPRLIDWLRERYNPQSTGERWYQLSERAKRALREWIGAVNYNDFANLVDRLLQVLPLEDRERNQLHRRKQFWADYSNQFVRIRILLPQTSVNALNNINFTTDIETLAIDGSAPTEICVFDFGDWFVVEFFRGPGSETRLFRRNSQLEQVLFGSRISVKRLRCLGGEVHDHRYLWQVFCQEWLQNKGIYQNPGTLPPRQPRLEQKLQREEQLRWWRREIERIEQQARELY